MPGRELAAPLAGDLPAVRKCVALLAKLELSLIEAPAANAQSATTTAWATPDTPTASTVDPANGGSVTTVVDAELRGICGRTRISA